MTVHDATTSGLLPTLLLALCAASFRIRPSEALASFGGRHRAAAAISSSLRLPSSMEEGSPDVLGLTDDGDFAIAGINTDHPLVFGSSSSSDAVPRLDGPSPLFGTGISPLNAPVEERDGVDTADVENRQDEILRIEAWLSKVLPALNPTDRTAYSRELVSIGFDPECVSRSELRFDDLRFMKLLHRRYIFNELMGAGHPSLGDDGGRR